MIQLTALAIWTVHAIAGTNSVAVDGLSIGMSRQDCDTLQAQRMLTPQVWHWLERRNSVRLTGDEEGIGYFCGPASAWNPERGPVVLFRNGHLRGVQGTQLSVGSHIVRRGDSIEKLNKLIGHPDLVEADYSWEPVNGDHTLVNLVQFSNYAYYRRYGLGVYSETKAGNPIDAFHLKEEQR